MATTDQLSHFKIKFFYGNDVCTIMWLWCPDNELLQFLWPPFRLSLYLYSMALCGGCKIQVMERWSQPIVKILHSPSSDASSVSKRLPWRDMLLTAGSRTCAQVNIIIWTLTNCKLDLTKLLVLSIICKLTEIRINSCIVIIKELAVKLISLWRIKR